MKFISEKHKLLKTIQGYIDSLEVLNDQSHNFFDMEEQRKLIEYYYDEIMIRVHNAKNRYIEDYDEFFHNKKWWQSSKKKPNAENYIADITDLCDDARMNDIAIFAKPFGDRGTELIIGDDFISDNIPYRTIDSGPIPGHGSSINIKAMNNNIHHPRVLNFKSFFICTKDFLRSEFGRNGNKEIIENLRKFYKVIKESHSDYIEHNRSDQLDYYLERAKSLIEENSSE